MKNSIMSFVDKLPNKPFIKTRTRQEIMKVYREEVPSAKPSVLKSNFKRTRRPNHD
jgi:hypothetical protein